MQSYLNDLWVRIFVCFFAFQCPQLAFAENLYQEDKYQALITDEKAFKIGDLVTLIIVESARANTNTDEAKGRNMNIGATASKSLSVVNPPNRDGRAVGVSADFEFASDKAASNKRSGAFNGQITLVVTEVKDTDKLYVTGEQKINVNGNEQLIRASGWLRTQDIDQNNTALSIRLNDAKIEYSGEQETKHGIIRTLWKYIKKIW